MSLKELNQALAENKAKVEQLIEKAQSGGGGLPDWDDDSPIIASGDNGDKNAVWTLTEKGTLRWKYSGSKVAGWAYDSFYNYPSDYVAIMSQIRQIYFEDGYKTNGGLTRLANCERIRFSTDASTIIFNVLPAFKEMDLNIATFTTSIASYQFRGFNSLKKVIMKPSIITIGANAFTDCWSLTEIDLTNITTFNTNCFSDCYSLSRDAVFNKNLISIGNSAFTRSGLKSVKFQNSTDKLPSIANNSFSYCTWLTDIYCPWAEGAVANAPWGATNATIHYNSEV